MTQMLSMGYGDVLVPLALLALWPIILVTVIAFSRVGQVMQGKADAATSFPSGEKHGTDGYWRLNRAHMNTQENLGMIAIVIFAAILSGYDAGSLTTLTWVILGGRLVQSVVQIASGSAMAVNVRFAGYLVQLVCLLIIIFGIVTG